MFVSCVLELLLENVVWIVAVWDTDYETAAHLLDTVMEAYQGRSRLMALYKRLGRGSLSTEIEVLGYVAFMRKWDRVVTIRNRVVHGKLEGGASISPELVRILMRDGVEVFRLLYNKYNRETLAHKVARKAASVAKPDQNN